MPFRRRKITKEKVPLCDFFIGAAVVFLLIAVLLGLMLWLFNESLESQ